MSQPTNVWFKKKLVIKLFKETFQWYSKETGGILAGYFGDNGDIVITKITTSGPKAVHQKFSYIPDYSYDEKQVERIYSKSKRTEIYLGDWHSHPKSNAYLSSTDKETLTKISSYKKARISNPIMMVVGTQPLEIKIWQLENGSITQLVVNLF